jgi:hypothetical protein
MKNLIIIGFMISMVSCVHTQNEIYVDRKLRCVKELLEQGVEGLKAAKVCGEIYDRK